MALDRTTTIMLRGLMVVIAAGVITVSGVAIYQAGSDDEAAPQAVSVTLRPVQSPSPTLSVFPKIDPASDEAFSYLGTVRDRFPIFDSATDEGILSIGQQACTLLAGGDETQAVAQQMIDESSRETLDMSIMLPLVIEADRLIC